MLPKLNREDYQLVNYWYKHQWVSSGDRITNIAGKVENEDEDGEVFELDALEAYGEGEEARSTSPAPAAARRGQARSRAGINVAMCYIEDQYGQVIDGHRAREIRQHARANFVGFAMQEKHFASWGDADAISRRTYYNEMATRFEELRYCDLDWKSEQIAIDTFPGWKATWLKKQKKALEQKTGTKRGVEAAIEKPDPKRSKSDSVEIRTSSWVLSDDAFITQVTKTSPLL